MPVIHLQAEPFAGLAAEILQDGRRLRFTAPGHSMAPFVRHDDILEVAPIQEYGLRPGDILLYRRPNSRLIAHRVVRLVRRQGGLQIHTQGDALAREDGRIAPEQVLGQVVAVQRGERIIRMNSWAPRLAGLLWLRLGRGRALLLRGWRLLSADFRRLH
ncbi:MAG: S24/S26 family peptidase [Chloroflexota bacterium]